MKIDENSGILYFDPEKCVAVKESNPVLIQQVLKTIRSLGRLLGLVLVKHLRDATLPVNFPITLYKILLGMKIGTSDLSVINPVVVSSCQRLCLLDKETLDDCYLNFTTTMSNGKDTFELCPNGSARNVDQDNRMEYLYMWTKYSLCCAETGNEDNNNIFLSLILGVQDMCPRHIFHHMSPVALQLVIEGSREIDVGQWRLYAVVRSSFAVKDIIDWFWQIVGDMDELDKRRLLVFSMGTACLPAKGFEDLTKPFSIVINAAMSNDSLPTSHTCFNMLVLPRYTSFSRLRDKLLQAIRETDTAQLGMA